MISRKSISVLIVVISALSCIIGSIVITCLFSHVYASDQYNTLSKLTEFIVSKYPEEEQSLLRVIKDNMVQKAHHPGQGETVLSSNGFTAQSFLDGYRPRVYLYCSVAISIFLLLIITLIMLIKKGYRDRINRLTNYLEQMNQEKVAVIPAHKEDDFSLLEDELYKTFTKLRQAREEAIREHSILADSLADISHQIKTPVVSISLMTQLLSQEQNNTYTECIKKRINHLERLVEALLTLARIDAGTLRLERVRVNVYTMLQLCIEELSEIIRDKKLQLVLENHEEFYYEGDMEWSIEAFINLLKNSVEHTPEGGSIKIDYFHNPLYLQIQMEDTGEGFLEKDLPHIFERFYRSDRSSGGGAGIGLSLAKALIEQQNGIISAGNLPDGGACFIIRFYCH